MTTKLQPHPFKILITTIIFILSAGYYFDIKPNLKKILTLSAEEKKWHEQFKNEKNLISQSALIQQQLKQLDNHIAFSFREKNPIAVSTELLSNILRTAELNGVLIETVQPVAWHSIHKTEALIFNLFAISDFLQFARFISDLSQHSLPFLLQDFNLNVEQHDEIKINFQLAGFYVPAEKKSLPKGYPRIEMDLNDVIHDPFSLPIDKQSELTNDAEEDKSLLQTISVKQIKFVGYLKNPKQFFALIMFPNNKSIAVSKGMLMGSEKAEIVSINEKFIEMKSKTGKFYLPYEAKRNVHD